MADGIVRIIITDSENDTGKSTVETKPAKSFGGARAKENKADVIGDYAKVQFFNLIKQQAITQVDYEISKIGNLKGEYVRQHNIEANLTIGKQIAGIGMSAIAGAKYGGLWGALIAGGVATISTGASYIRQENMIAKQNAITNFNINYLRERSGLSSLTNGSRGTEN